MYKYLGAIFCIILILFCSPSSDFVSSVSEYSGSIYFSTSQNFSSRDTTTIPNGRGYIVSASTKDAKNIYALLDQDQLQGCALITSDPITVSDFFAKLNATVVFSEVIDDIAFYYAYTYQLSRFISYDNQKINLQIAVNNGTTTIGYPVILIGA